MSLILDQDIMAAVEEAIVIVEIEVVVKTMNFREL